MNAFVMVGMIPTILLVGLEFLASLEGGGGEFFKNDPWALSFMCLCMEISHLPISVGSDGEGFHWVKFFLGKTGRKMGFLAKNVNFFRLVLRKWVIGRF